MMYSVWNQAAGAFDYFESSNEQAKLNVEKPGHLASRALGSTPDQAAWPLPGGVRKIGSGPTAIGRVASARGIGLGASDDSSLMKIGLLAVAAYLTWTFAVKGHRS